VLALAIGTMRSLALNEVKARIGNIGILRDYLPFAPADQAVILHSLDKRNFAVLDSELGRLGRSDLAKPLRQLIGLSGDLSILDEAADVLGGAGKEGFDYLRRLAGLLEAYGISRSYYAFDMGVVRGLDYYTGMVFEIDSPNLGAEKQVGGGGAYSLAELLGGERVAQTGFALGLDRLVMAAVAENVPIPTRRLTCYVIPVGEGLRAKAIMALRELRREGFSADIDLVGRGPSKNLDYANAIGARFAVIVGERETKRNLLTVKNLESGEQEETTLEAFVRNLRLVFEDERAQFQSPRREPSTRKVSSKRTQRKRPSRKS